MAKVTQMLDAGWRVRIFKSGMGSYVAVAAHENEAMKAPLRKLPGPIDIFWIDEDDEVVTDDFTPEQALTRLAYKVHGQILGHDYAEDTE